MESEYGQYVRSQGFSDVMDFSEWLSSADKYNDPLALLLLAMWNGSHISVMFMDYEWHTHHKNAKNISDPCIFHVAVMEDSLCKLLWPFSEGE